MHRFCRTQPLKALAYCVLAALSVAVIVRASSRSNAEARRFGERFDAGGGSGEKIDEVRIEMGRRREDPQLYRAAWVPLPPFKSDCTLRRRRKMRDKLVVLSRRLGVPEQDEQGGLGPLDHLAAHAHPHVRAAAHGPHQRVVEERDHLRAALALCEAQFGKLQEVGKDRSRPARGGGGSRCPARSPAPRRPFPCSPSAHLTRAPRAQARREHRRHVLPLLRGDARAGRVRGAARACHPAQLQ